MTKYLAQLFITINGADAPQAFMDDLLEVVVDSSLSLPDMFTILVRDSDLQWVDDGRLDVGKAVEIRVQVDEESGGQSGTLINGEIVALEPEFSVDGDTRLQIRGYTKAHRLHRGKKTRTFLQQTDSQIVQTLASEAGLSAAVDRTNTTYDYVLQYNQTNMEFLQARAQRIGYQVSGADGKLYFKKGDASQGTGPVLEFGANLRSFRPRLAATHQANEVSVKGWDAKGKTVISGQASPNAALNQGGYGKTGGAAAQSAFADATATIVGRPVASIDEANALAAGLSNDLSREFIQAEGVCDGDPRVKAGWTVTIKNVGSRFSGPYRITSALHVYNRDGYETRFSISGREPDTLGHLLAPEMQAGANGTVRGVVTGLVTNLNDPDNLGRVKVKYAWLGEVESFWVRMASPAAGGGRGFEMLPEVNDEVLLGFEHGDVQRPYILGVLWNSKDKPPQGNSQAVSGGKVTKRLIKSRSGHTILLDDSDGAEQIVIQDKTGSNKIVIDSASNSMTISVAKDMTIDAKGAVTIKSVGKMDLKSVDDVSIQGKNVTVKAQMKGSFEAMTQLALKGTVSTSVENGMGAKVALTGPTVNINNGALEII